MSIINTIKIPKVDKSGSILSTTTIANAGSIKFTHPNASSSFFEISDIVDKGDYIQLRVLSNPEATPNIETYSAISDYKYGIDSLTTSSYTIEGSNSGSSLVSIKFDPAANDFINGYNKNLSLSLMPIGNGEVNDTYLINKMPNVSIQWGFSASLSSSANCNLNIGVLYSTASEGVIPGATQGLFTIPLSQSYPAISSNGNFEGDSFKNVSLTPAKTSIHITGSIRADLLPANTQWNLFFRLPDTTTRSIDIEEALFYITYATGSVGGIETWRDSEVTSSTYPDISPLIFEPDFGGEKFAYSGFDVLQNNAVNTRNNSFLLDVDYSTNAISPINYQSIISGSATKATLPDSNYTTTRIIKPRYEGSRLSSANYNKYTPPGSVKSLDSVLEANSNPPVLNSFLNGDNGSYNGDISYGKTAVVDNYPRYFAYFSSSIASFNIWDTFSYKINQIIEVPNVDISNVATYTPNTIKIQGNNENLLNVTNIFDVGRKLKVAYEQEGDDNQSYNSFKNKTFEIIESGIEYINLFSNEVSPVSTSVDWTFDRFSRNEIFSGTYNISESLMITGSGYLRLTGSVSSYQTVNFTKNFEGNENLTGSMGLRGPFLAVFHTYNQVLANALYYTASVGTNASASINPTIIPTDSTNYIFTNYTNNILASQYTNNGKPEEPFLLQRGDEIRVRYGFQTATTFETITQDFTILSVPSRIAAQSSPSNPYVYLEDGVLFPSVGGFNFHNIFDTIYVTPDPSTLSKSIPSGSITSFTVRRRVLDESQILISKSPPTGSIGSAAPTSDGFLIPDDLSQVQKANILNIINNLKNQNSF